MVYETEGVFFPDPNLEGAVSNLNDSIRVVGLGAEVGAAYNFNSIHVTASGPTWSLKIGNATIDAKGKPPGYMRRLLLKWLLSAETITKE